MSNIVVPNTESVDVKVTSNVNEFDHSTTQVVLEKTKNICSDSNVKQIKNIGDTDSSNKDEDNNDDEVKTYNDKHCGNYPMKFESIKYSDVLEFIPVIFKGFGGLTINTLEDQRLSLNAHSKWA